MVRGIIQDSKFDVSQFNADVEGPLVLVMFDNECLISVRSILGGDQTLTFQSPICVVAVGDFRHHISFT